MQHFDSCDRIIFKVELKLYGSLQQIFCGQSEVCLLRQLRKNFDRKLNLKVIPEKLDRNFRRRPPGTPVIGDLGVEVQTATMETLELTL